MGFEISLLPSPPILSDSNEILTYDIGLHYFFSQIILETFKQMGW